MDMGVWLVTRAWQVGEACCPSLEESESIKTQNSDHRPVSVVLALAGVYRAS